MPESVMRGEAGIELDTERNPTRIGTRSGSAASSLTEDAPEISAAEAEQLARKMFGLAGQARILTGERDLNFMITSPNGSGHVLKIANAREQESVLILQAKMLEHIERRAPSLSVPRVLRALDGSILHRVSDRTGRLHFVSVLTFLNGRPLASVGLRPELAARSGRLLAQLHAAMCDFHAPTPNRMLPWELSRASQLEDKLHHVREPELRARCASLLSSFAAKELPVLGGMPQHFIHNDFNPHNLIVSNKGEVGVIDFGDMVKAARISDLAIAACYQCAAGNGSLGLAPKMVIAYHLEESLELEEIAALPVLMAIRAVQTVVITAWRASLYPENSAYILRNRPAALATLDRLGRMDAPQVTEQLLGCRNRRLETIGLE